MSTKDLRIGNYVRHNGRIIVVKNIFAKSVNLEIDKESFKVEKYIPAADLEPIPLTHSLMYRFGFREVYRRYHLRTTDKNTPEVVIEQRTVEQGEVYFVVTSWDYVRVCGVKYVHQLQNVIFGMYGIELKIKRF